jgi:hypothetical protein
MSVFGILGLVAALLFGIYWGLPTRYEQTVEEIDQRLGEEGEHARVRRRTTVLNLLQRKMQKGSDRRFARGRGRRPFRY